MPITNPQAVKFANEVTRPFADRSAQRYYEAKTLVAQWNAQALSLVIPNDATVIVDGAEIDGRPLLTGAAVTNVVTRALELVADYEANASAKLNTIMAVAVNPHF